MPEPLNSISETEGMPSLQKQKAAGAEPEGSLSAADPSEVARLTEELAAARAALRKAKEDLHWELAVGSALRELHRPLISPDSTIEEMAKLVLAKARELTGSPRGYVSALNPQTGQVEGHATAAADAGVCGISGKCPKADPLEDGSSVCLWSRERRSGPRYFTNRTKAVVCDCLAGGATAIERFLCVPVMLDGKPAAKIALANSPRDYSSRDVQAVRHLAGFYALAIDRKRYQTGIIDALREKEVLLREVHHRVKNNLQVISSLLSLQAGGLRDPKALEMLKESQNRVRSMAMVHEHLHRSRELSRISFGEYVRNLCASLFSSYGIDSARIGLQIQLQDVSFAIDTAIPCGLIIQELVSNSLKYAFPAGRSGQIAIRLQPGDGPSMTLSVSDDGVGLPPTVDFAGSNSLGLRLVRILAAQMDGAVQCFSGKGTSFRIEFKCQESS
ncbi:MAG: GAF domain-containing protein [Bryobacteraceae bacterium]|nr:GAF domain-containing protein [Bryobacteraceae bacterium]